MHGLTKVKRTLVLAAAALTALWSAGLAAQEAPKKPEFVVVYIDAVKPAMVKEYESAVKDMAGLLTAEKADSPAFDYWAFSGRDMTYSYVTPMDSFGALDVMHVEWMKLYKGPDKDKWKALDERMSKDLEYSTRLIAMRVAEGSYMPKEPRFKMREAPFRWYDYFYVMPGREGEFIKLAKGLAEAAEKGGFNDPWTIYQVIAGEQMPLFVVVSPAKDAADYEQSEKAFMKAIGEEGQKFIDGIMAVTRRYESRTGWYRPDLGYQTPSTLEKMKGK
jgi:hypothetical protein